MVGVNTMPKSAMTLPRTPKYKTVENKAVPNFMCITIESGPCAGIEYHYNTVKIGNEDDDGGALLNFTYNIMSGTPTNVGEFEEQIGAILFDIVEQSTETEEKV